MYPFIRVALAIRRSRKAPPMGITDTLITEHRCLPWDLDVFVELNNGRTLTLYDISRLSLAYRTGLMQLLRRQGWGLTVAGCSVRYRRRVRLFDRFEMHSRVVGWDARFIYIEHSMWRDGECTSHLLARTAVTDPDGIVPTERVREAFGLQTEELELPDWVAAWIAAEATRPWPPMQGVAPGSPR